MHRPCETSGPLYPLPVATTTGLRQAQRLLADLAVPIIRSESVPLAQAVGRIVASAVPPSPRASLRLVGSPSALSGGLAEGTRIDVQHTPMLAAAGVTRVEVRARPRIAVLTLGEEGVGTPAMAARAGVTGTTLAALARGLGAEVAEAPCPAGDDAALARTLALFIAEFDLVLVAGFLAPTQADAVRAELSSTHAAASAQDVVFRPIGALQLVRAGTKLALGLSPDPGSAFSAFVMLVSPLIRRLQGRGESLPEPRQAILEAETVSATGAWGLFHVREVDAANSSRLLLRPCIDDDPAVTVAQATGLAWRPIDLPSRHRTAVAYYPFHEWLAA